MNQKKFPILGTFILKCSRNIAMKKVKSMSAQAFIKLCPETLFKKIDMKTVLRIQIGMKGFSKINSSQNTNTECPHH